MKQKGNKYLLKVLILLIIVYCLDFTIGFCLRKYYFSQTQGEYSVLTRTIENPKKQKYDLLVFGSSKAKRHYNPAIISDSLNITCYNAGNDGMGILYSNALFDLIIEKYNPEFVLLDVINDELDYASFSYDQLGVFNPYVDKYPILWETLKLRSPFEKIKHISKIYPFNSMADKIIKGNMGENSEIDIDGFSPEFGIWKESLKEIKFEEKQLDTNKLVAFESFLTKCKNRNIKIAVIFSPEYHHILNNSNSIGYIMEKCQELDVDFISYKNDEYFSNNELFRDQRHMNEQGAIFFSTKLSSMIKKTLFTEQ